MILYYAILSFKTLSKTYLILRNVNANLIKESEMNKRFYNTTLSTRPLFHSRLADNYINARVCLTYNNPDCQQARD